MALLRLSGPAALPSVVPLVEQHGTSSELITLLAFHGWRPANQRQEVYFWLALDRQELLAHWEQTKRVLLVPPYYNYSLFLSLRKHDPEVINAMVSLLNTVTPPQGVNQKSLAENYFRSDHPSLVIAGARWLSNHGTRVELWSLPFGRNIHIPAGNFNAQFANQIRNQMGPQGRWE